MASKGSHSNDFISGFTRPYHYLLAFTLGDSFGDGITIQGDDLKCSV